MINVTKPFLPPLEEYNSYLQDIWQRNWLTNNGPLVNELELKLKKHLGLPHLLYLNNGTVALQIAIKALGLKEKVITSPFSFVATTSSIIWEGCEPLFVDINKDTFNIDASLIEQAITPDTTAILATHVYGNPCDIDAITEIAKKHNLKVIYDAAHCFGTSYKGQSVFAYGDVSITSFHATKMYHTTEGGAVFTQNADLLRRMALMRNFGHDGPEVFSEIGINGKNSEFHAAMGLAVFKYIDEIYGRRRLQWEHYTELLKGLRVQTLKIQEGAAYNYAYFPIVFETEELVLEAMKTLNANYIYPRRYFYPSLNNISFTSGGSCPVSEYVAARTLCLPLYHSLSGSEQEMIARVLLRMQNNR